jgi:hypothetical protein
MAANAFRLRFAVRALALPLSCGLISLALCGCGQKTDVKSQASQLEKAFQDISPAMPSANQRPSAAPLGSPPTDAKILVDLALSAVRTNDLAQGVIALQKAQRAPRLTTEQHRAVYQAMQAMTHDLLVRAANGDAKAKADLAAIEKTRSQ